MIDKKFIGLSLPTEHFEIEAGRLRFFAKATGETRPEYVDTEAAKAAGFRAIPAPPTFLFAAEMDSGALFRLLDEIQVPIVRILHGEQRFEYHQIACAGDVLQVDTSITDIYSKKGGAMEFIVKKTSLCQLDGTPVLDARSVIIVRNPPEERE